jgi:hypothetical protein
VISITPLRRGDQLDEIRAPVPNGCIGQSRSGQHDAARIDTARRKQGYVIAQTHVADVAVLTTLDQAHLMGDRDSPWERAHQLRCIGEDARADFALAERHVERQRAALSKANQHEPAGIEPELAQLMLKDLLEMSRLAVEDVRLDVGIGIAGRLRGDTAGRGTELLHSVQHNERRRGHSRCPAVRDRNEHRSGSDMRHDYHRFSRTLSQWVQSEPVRKSHPRHDRSFGARPAAGARQLPVLERI